MQDATGPASAAVRRRRFRRRTAALGFVVAGAYLAIATGVVIVVQAEDFVLVRQLAMGMPAVAAYLAGATALWWFDSRILAAIGAVFQVFAITVYLDMLFQGLQDPEPFGLAIAAVQAVLLVLLLRLAIRPHPLQPSAAGRRQTVPVSPSPVSDVPGRPPGHEGERPLARPPQHGTSTHTPPAASPTAATTGTTPPVRVLVVYASRLGGTARIARMIADELRAYGLDVEVATAAATTSLARFDAVIVGSAIYRRQWLQEARHFIRQHYTTLVQVPVWMFSSGPLHHTAAVQPATRYVRRIMRDVGAEDHTTFGGRLSRSPKGLLARYVARRHAGDWLDPDRVARWSRDIALFLLRTHWARP